MAHIYSTFGPFTFDQNEALRTTYKKALIEFWRKRETDSPTGLAEAVGVYIWTVTRRGKELPWNVGKTDSQGFKKRFGQKELGFKKFLDTIEGGNISVYLLALTTPARGTFQKPNTKTSLKVNDWLESMLIGTCIGINPDLRNASKVKYLKTTRVEGYLDSAKHRSAAAKALSGLLGT